MIPEYREQAEYLIKATADLQKLVLIKHTAAILEEIHDQLKARDEEIERIRTAGTKVIAAFETLGRTSDHFTLLKARSECERAIVALSDAIKP